MKRTTFLPSLLFAFPALVAFALSVSAAAADPTPAQDELTHEIAALDATVFDAFNHCSDPARLQEHASYFAPDVEQDFVWLTPGSVTATLLWLTASVGFRLYVVNFGAYNQTYGAIGAVMVLLGWPYLSALAVIVGGELNAEIEHASTHSLAAGPILSGRRRIIGVRAAPAHVRVERIPVGFAQRGQRGPCRGRVVAACRNDQAPLGGLERHGRILSCGA